MLNLSHNFLVSELFGEIQPTGYQRWLAAVLAARVLEVVREVVGGPVYVTDGFRDQTRHHDLKRRGYHPYRFTDHSFGHSWQPLGVGAGDLIPLVKTRQGNLTRGKFTEAQYDAVVTELSSEVAGQVIWYRKRGHIHVSNPRSLVYTRVALSELGLPGQRWTYINEN